MTLGYANKIKNTQKDYYQLKWLSADNVMFVTEHGRITKTVNLKVQNITSTHSEQLDPLILGLLNPTTPLEWKREIDIQPINYFSLFVSSRFKKIGKGKIIINEKEIPTVHFHEYVIIPALKKTFTNEFWIHDTTQEVVMSKQKLGPNLPRIELITLKPFSNK